MINEDIITSLKNAVERGETLENAIATAIYSGYNSAEVHEAAKYIGSGVINIEKISNERILAMPNKKSFFSRKPAQIKPQTPKIVKPIQPTPAPIPTPQPINQLPSDQTAQEIKQTIQANSISPPVLGKPKQSYGKEITLLILLLLLVGILIITIAYRDVIIKFFAG